MSAFEALIVAINFAMLVLGIVSFNKKDRP
jgi:hypothetical protein